MTAEEDRMKKRRSKVQVLSVPRHPTHLRQLHIIILAQNFLEAADFVMEVFGFIAPPTGQGKLGTRKLGRELPPGPGDRNKGTLVLRANGVRTTNAKEGAVQRHEEHEIYLHNL